MVDRSGDQRSTRTGDRGPSYAGVRAISYDVGSAHHAYRDEVAGAMTPNATSGDRCFGFVIRAKLNGGNLRLLQLGASNGALADFYIVNVLSTGRLQVQFLSGGGVLLSATTGGSIIMDRVWQGLLVKDVAGQVSYSIDGGAWIALGAAYARDASSLARATFGAFRHNTPAVDLGSNHYDGDCARWFCLEGNPTSANAALFWSALTSSRFNGDLRILEPALAANPARNIFDSREGAGVDTPAFGLNYAPSGGLITRVNGPTVVVAAPSLGQSLVSDGVNDAAIGAYAPASLPPGTSDWTFVTRFHAVALSGGRIAQWDTNSNNDRVGVYVTGGLLKVIVTIGGVTVVNAGTAPVAVETDYLAMLRHTASTKTLDLWLDNTLSTSSVYVGSLAAFTHIRLGDTAGGTPIQGFISATGLFAGDLSGRRAALVLDPYAKLRNEAGANEVWNDAGDVFDPIGGTTFTGRLGVAALAGSGGGMVVLRGSS